MVAKRKYHFSLPPDGDFLYLLKHFPCSVSLLESSNIGDYTQIKNDSFCGIHTFLFTKLSKVLFDDCLALCEYRIA